MNIMKNTILGAFICVLSLSISNKAATIADAKNIIDNAIEKSIIIDSESIKAIITEKLDKGLETHVQALQTMLENAQKTVTYHAKVSELLRKAVMGIGGIAGFASGYIVLDSIFSVADQFVSTYCRLAQDYSFNTIINVTLKSDYGKALLSAAAHAGAFSVITLALVKKCYKFHTSRDKHKIETQNIGIINGLLIFLKDAKKRSVRNSSVLDEQFSSQNNTTSAYSGDLLEYARALYAEDLARQNNEMNAIQ